MQYFILILLLCSDLFIFAQKPVLDTSAFRKWAGVDEGMLSDDGNYASYHINNQPVGTRQLIIQSTNGSWKKELPGSITLTGFSRDSRLAIYKAGRDSLWLLTLGQDGGLCIPHVSMFVPPGKSSGDWLVYRLTTEEGTLILRDLPSGKELRFPSVTSYQFTDDAKRLLLETRVKKDSNTESSLKWLDLQTNDTKFIWSGLEMEQRAGDCAVGPNRRLAFILERKLGDGVVHELWYYEPGMSGAAKLADNGSAGIESGLVIADQVPGFTKDGNAIFFGIQSIEKINPTTPKAVQVEVWSYADKVLYPLQDRRWSSSIYSCLIDIQDKKITRLERPGESVAGVSGPFILMKHEPEFYTSFESNWNASAQSSYWVVSTGDSSRKLLKDHLVHPQERLVLSPEGRWILYYDAKQKNYFSYEPATGITRNITRDIPVSWIDGSNDRPDYKLTWVPWRRTWLQNDEAVLICDNWDIWQVDPAGLRPPVNITNGYGRRHHIKFDLAIEGSGFHNFSVEGGSKLLLTAFDASSKDRGFYSKTLGIISDPVQRVMGPYVFGDWQGYNSYNYPPVKARSSNTYLLKRMSAKEAPNYFILQDLTRLIPLTNVQPQQAYNWMRTELVHWKTFDGIVSAGVLYKPEDFDSTRKYPLLFDYYEQRSEELNLFIRPGYSEDRINIPWYVSHGYLVCTPDIHYKRGTPGQSAYNSVVSAALYLSKKPWVDARRMGIQGHSFGGYETNYIITHTKLFAAACSASGISDLVSWYGATLRGSYPKFWAEREQGRIGGSPWQIPSQYISESPIFRADKVSTPLLLMGNRGDRTVSFEQGVEFFTALRRLDKRVWMLNYDEGGHGVGGREAIDYSIRMYQFFDHYLKDAPAPVWMTRGIPAWLKGVDDGLELDGKISTPGPGLDKN